MKYILSGLGLLFVGMAFIGLFLPGIPTTFPAIVAAWLFSKSSPRLNKWIHTNKFFGHLVTQWEQKRIYPLWGKFSQYGVLLITNIFFHVKYDNMFPFYLIQLRNIKKTKLII